MTKRTDPGYTYEQTAKLTLDSALELIGDGSDPKE
jgi:hypothetical protein